MATRLARRKQEALDAYANKSKHKVKSLVSITVLVPGDAFNFPKVGDSLSVHYRAFLEDGTQIDDSYKRGQPMNFILGAGQVITG